MMFNDLTYMKRTWAPKLILVALWLSLSVPAALADTSTLPADDIKNANPANPQIQNNPQPPYNPFQTVGPQNGEFYKKKMQEELPLNIPTRATPLFVVPLIANCGPTTLSLCNTPVTVPFSGTPGSTYTVTLPPPNQDKGVSVICANVGNISLYQVINPEALSCAYPQCPESTVTVCGVPIEVTGGASIGATIDVPLPAAALGTNATYNHPSFKAACIAKADGTAAYQMSDDAGISCNVFPCADTSLRLCETSVPIKGGATLGDVLHVTMQAPFVADPFDVSCVGTLGQQPMYQITDMTAVTCNKLSPSKP